jgi:alpha-beta hydrolase superfamily lysophospholipase
MNALLTMADGLRLHVREWPCEAARGTVLIVHGLGEHIERYAHVAEWLNRHHWRVIGYDQRGHGRSAGGRGALQSDVDLPRDLSAVIDAARAEHRGPLVLLGHSMGGLVAAHFCAEGMSTGPAAWYRPVDGLVLSSPAFDLGLSLPQKLLLGVLERVAPNLAVGSGLKPVGISRDPAVVKAYVDDPLVHDRITPRLLRFMLAGGDWVREHAANWSLQTLLMYAGADRIVNPAGSAEFAQAAPPATVTPIEFGPLFHEIFNEPERAEVLATLGAWLETFSARL